LLWNIRSVVAGEEESATILTMVAASIVT